MRLEIQIPKPGLLAATYLGPVTIEERFLAKDTIDRAATAAGVRRVLIDMRQASVAPYGTTDALRVVRKVANDPVFGRLAYVLPPGQADMVADVLANAHGADYFRSFHDWEAAADWLVA